MSHWARVRIGLDSKTFSTATGTMTVVTGARQRPALAHHLVSKFYLRHFADEDELVTTVLLPGDRTFSQSVNRASVENDFYTAIGHDGEETDAAERAFNEIEGPASEVWRLIAGGMWPLPPEERGVVAGWIALHMLRGTRSRATMSEIGTDLLQLEIIAGGTARLRDVLRDIGEPYDGDSVAREWISLFQEPLSVQANANHHLAHIVEMLPRVTESLADRWWVLTSFERKGLATCDQPVFVAPNERPHARTRDRYSDRGSDSRSADAILVAGHGATRHPAGWTRECDRRRTAGGGCGRRPLRELLHGPQRPARDLPPPG